MNFILQIFYKILAFFSKEESPKPIPEGIIISPIRFQHIEKEQSTRAKEESLKLFQAFQKVEREKQETISKTTKDSIIQRGILNSGDDELILLLSSNPWLEEDLQIIIAEEDYNLKIKTSLARKIGLSIEVQQILASSPDVEIRRMLVRWQRPINPTLAKILIKDDDLEIRKTLALTIGEKMQLENILCFRGKEQNFQMMLVEDENSEVRGSLTINKNLNEEVQLALVQVCYNKKEWKNLLWLAENESLSPKVALFIEEKLITDWPSFQKASILKKLKGNKGLNKTSIT